MRLNKYIFWGLMLLSFPLEATDGINNTFYGFEELFLNDSRETQTLPSIFDNDDNVSGSLAPNEPTSAICGEDWRKNSEEILERVQKELESSGAATSQQRLGGFSPLSFTNRPPDILSSSPAPDNPIIKRSKPISPVPEATSAAQRPESSAIGKRKDRGEVDPAFNGATLNATSPQIGALPKTTGKRKERELNPPSSPFIVKTGEAIGHTQKTSRTFVSIAPEPPRVLQNQNLGAVPRPKNSPIYGIVNTERHLNLLRVFGDGSQLISIHDIRKNIAGLGNINSFINVQKDRGWIEFLGDGLQYDRMTSFYKITANGKVARQHLESEQRKLPQVLASNQNASLAPTSSAPSSHSLAQASSAPIAYPTSVARTSRSSIHTFNFFTAEHPQAQAQWEVYLHQDANRDHVVSFAVSQLAKVLQRELNEFAQRQGFSLRPGFETQLMEYVSRKVRIDTLDFKP